MTRSPARKLTKSAVKNIVRFPAIKANGGKAILVESILESKYCLHLEFDSNVEAYYPQPKTFEIQDEYGSARYTPDFEVRHLSGERVYVEVKPLKQSDSDHFQLLFTRFQSALRKSSNSSFLVVDDQKIYEQPLLSNYEKLYQFKKRPFLDMRNLVRCAGRIKRKMPLSSLIAELGDSASLRETYSWLALGYLHFDIRSEPLTMATEVEFYVHRVMD